MGDSIFNTIFASVFGEDHCLTQCGRKRSAEEEEDKKAKKIKTDSVEPLIQSSNDELPREADNRNGSDLEDNTSVEPHKTTDMDAQSSDAQQITETFTTEELSQKLVPSLESLIIKGCLDNDKSKSSLIRETNKYCAHNYSSIQMLSKSLSAIDLLAENKLIDFCRKYCSRLKCLRLSYCILSVDLMKTILECFRSLQCLHLEYIYGIETAEEWTELGKIFSKSIICLSISCGNRDMDLSGMLKNLKHVHQLSLEDYKNDMSKLFSSVSRQTRKLSLINYFDVDLKAVEALAKRCGLFLNQLELTYDSFDNRRANSLGLFAAVCKLLPEVTELHFKFINGADTRSVFKLTKLKELDLYFSNANFVYFPGVYQLDSLRTLSLTKAQFTPSRMEGMAKAFPFLKELSISGPKNKHFLDSPVFCCECKNKDKTIDNCSLCYQNCVIALIEFSILKTLKLNYINIKSSISTALPYIPSLKYLIINPFECDCSRSLLMAAIKIADMRPFKLIIRNCFIREALTLEQKLPENLEVIEYTEYSDK